MYIYIYKYLKKNGHLSVPDKIAPYIHIARVILIGIRMICTYRCGRFDYVGTYIDTSINRPSCN